MNETRNPISGLEAEFARPWPERPVSAANKSGKPRPWRWLAVLLAAALIFAACGDDDDEEPAAPAEAPAEEPAADPEPEPEPEPAEEPETAAQPE
ncbi:MAG: hypothetical protein OXC00_14150, partial [Acidimicrobiaceae bacterium]|nr:hypothetical protein [Acidimicrobiaceae bacterium]